MGSFDAIKAEADCPVCHLEAVIFFQVKAGRRLMIVYEPGDEFPLERGNPDLIPVGGYYHLQGHGCCGECANTLIAEILVNEKTEKIDYVNIVGFTVELSEREYITARKIKEDDRHER